MATEPTTTEQDIDIEESLDETDEPRVYELSYHLLPTIAEGDLVVENDAVKKMITDLGGLPITEEAPELIDLAYAMDKIIKNKREIFHRGYFGWIKFDIAADQMEALKTALDTHEKVLRFLLIKTVRQDTRAAKKFMQTKPRRAPRTTATPPAAPTKPEDQKPVDDKQLDKELDKIVA